MWKRRVVPTIFGLVIVLTLGLLRLADPYPVRMVRDSTFDFFQQIAPRQAAEFPVRVVDIDEASLTALGQWPWPRNMLAKLTDRLTEMGAAAIAFDFVFPEPDRLSPSRLLAGLDKSSLLIGPTLPDYDADFARALAAAPSVLGFGVTRDGTALPENPKSGLAISGEDPNAAVPLMPGAVLPLPLLENAASGLGSFSLNPADSTAIVRRLPLLWSNGKTLFPSLAVEALRVALGEQTLVVLGETNGAAAIEALRVGDFTIPTTPAGDLWLYYRPQTPDLYVSAKDILGAGFAQFGSKIAGNIVFVGTSANGLLDIRGTPLDADMPGVAIHAQAVEQILSGTYLTRSDWVLGLELLVIVVSGLSIVGIILWSGPLIGLLFAAMTGTLMVAGSWFAYKTYGLLIDPSFPLAGAMATYAAMLFFQFAITDADKRQIRRAFGHYVAPSLLSQIERSGDKLKLGGDVRPLSIMFCDIRNYTKISEGLEPAELVALLNTLFGALGAEITREFGTIDKFMGDAIMAFWNAPIDVEQHAQKACMAALAMRTALDTLNARDAFGLKAKNQPIDRIAVGIGIATGEVLVGNIGLDTRFDYSCVGDSVNTASRVETACKTVGYDLLVAERTRSEAPDMAFLEAGNIELKGKRTREPIYLLIGAASVAQSAEFAALLDAHVQALSALSRGVEADVQIARCKELAAEVDQQLVRFYELLAARKADFVG